MAFQSRKIVHDEGFKKNYLGTIQNSDDTQKIDDIKDVLMRLKQFSPNKVSNRIQETFQAADL